MRELVGALTWVGVLQGFVLAAVLSSRRANRLANRVLAGLVGAITLMLLLGDLQHRWAFAGHPHLLALGAPLPLLFGPLLYLYVVSLTRPVERPDPRWLAHATPFVADVVYMAWVFYLKPPDEKLALARASSVGDVPFSFHLVSLLEVVQALVYVLLAWRVLAAYGTKIQGYYSDLARIDLRWLRALVLVHAGIWSLVLVAVVLRWAGSAVPALSALVAVCASLAVFLTGWVSVWQPELAEKSRAAEPAPPPPEAEPQPERPRYQRNRLDDAEAKGIVAKLETLMSKEQLHRDPSLTLPALADAVGITPHMLSQVLNVHIGKSFFVYVNGLRAEALKELLADPSKSDRGVLELAFEVGFRSKSTVNSFFKKHTGQTPTQYRASRTAVKSRG